MRVVFLGTPDFAVPSLEALTSEHEVCAVFTQPDRPKGRGNKLTESPVKMAAKALGLPVYQPERIRRAPNPDVLAGFGAELMVVVGYGQIIPQNIIDLPNYGILNVHASLLPKYRGAAPIQWAIANGETETGVTIMQIDAGLDTGDMLVSGSLCIEADETAPELSGRLAPLGAQLLLTAIGEIAGRRARPHRQNEAEATLAPILKKEDGLIDWSLPAQMIYNRLRGFTPWPGCFTTFRSGQLTISRGRPAAGVFPLDANLAAGRMLANHRHLFVGCGQGTRLELMEVQPAGKSRMSAQAFLNGYQPVDNQSLGEPI